MVHPQSVLLTLISKAKSALTPDAPPQASGVSLIRHAPRAGGGLPVEKRLQITPCTLDAYQPRQAQSGVTEVSKKTLGPKISKFPKTDLRYWQAAIFQPIYTKARQTL